MYDDVLVPYDGSDGAAEVLHHASQLALWADAEIHVLYVADTTRDSVTVVEGQTVDALVQEGEDTIEEAERTLDSLGVAYDTDVVQGNPAPTIVDYAEEFDQDLIVMPTHGREGLSRYLIGSVSEKVVRLSSVPVLSVRMQQDESLEFPYERILVPTDGSEAATRAATHLVQFAAASDATLHVLSVVDDDGLGVDLRATESGEESEAAAREAVDAVADEAAAHDVEVVEHVEHGSPVEEILDGVEANDVHAVGMGTTGRRGTDRILLGSVAEKTVRSAPVPVLTVANPAE
ncbi:universal stress protein [Halobaculum sp. MBLA0147]|uniref:universal stress protein n=1 Tax=Halobaculum sp. MBLA0147 TaxID=3079934 RepID=UPI003526AB36